MVQEAAMKLVADKVAGGLLLPGDETGDCLIFTQRLAELAAGLGVVFKQETTVTRLVVEGGKVKHVETDAGSAAEIETGDAYVAALGSYTPLLVRPHGIRTQVYPVKGYSVTVPVIDEEGAPVSPRSEEHTSAPTSIMRRS